MFRKSVYTWMISLAFTCLIAWLFQWPVSVATATSLQLCCLTVIGQHLEGTHTHLSKPVKTLVPSMWSLWASPQSTSRCCAMNVYRGCSSAAWSADSEFPSCCSSCIACSLLACKPYGSLTQGRAGGKERTADQRAETTRATSNWRKAPWGGSGGGEKTAHLQQSSFLVRLLTCLVFIYIVFSSSRTTGL